MTFCGKKRESYLLEVYCTGELLLIRLRYKKEGPFKAGGILKSHQLEVYHDW